MAFSKEFLNNLAAGLYGGVKKADQQKILQQQNEQNLYKTLALQALQDKRLQEQLASMDQRQRDRLEAEKGLLQKRYDNELKLLEKKYEKQKELAGAKGAKTTSGIPKQLEPLIKARYEAYQAMLKSLLPDNTGTIDPNRTLYYKSQIDQYNDQLTQFGIPPLTVNENFLNKFLGVSKPTKPMSFESLSQGFGDPEFAARLLADKYGQTEDNRPTFDEYLAQRGQDVAKANKQVFDSGGNIDALKVQQNVPYTKQGADGNLYELTPNGWKLVKQKIPQGGNLEDIFGVQQPQLSDFLNIGK